MEEFIMLIADLRKDIEELKADIKRLKDKDNTEELIEKMHKRIESAVKLNGIYR